MQSEAGGGSDALTPLNWDQIEDIRLSNWERSKWGGHEYYRLITKGEEETIQHVKEGSTNLGEAIVSKVRAILSKFLKNKSPTQSEERVKEYSKSIEDGKITFKAKRGKSDLKVTIQDNLYQIQSGKTTFTLEMPEALSPVSPDVQNNLEKLKVKFLEGYNGLIKEISRLEAKGETQTQEDIDSLELLKNAKDKMEKLKGLIDQTHSNSSIEAYDMHIDSIISEAKPPVEQTSSTIPQNGILIGVEAHESAVEESSTEGKQLISPQQQKLGEDIKELSEEITAVRHAIKEKPLSSDQAGRTARSIGYLDGLLGKIDDLKADESKQTHSPVIIETNQHILKSYRRQFEKIKSMHFPLEEKKVKFSNELEQFINKWEENKELANLQRDALLHIKSLQADLKRKEIGTFTEFSEKQLNEIKNKFEILQVLFEKSSSQKLEMSNKKFQQEATALETKLKDFEVSLNKEDESSKSTLEKLHPLKTQI